LPTAPRSIQERRAAHVEPLLRRAWWAFREGRPRDVLALARRALREVPRSAPALHFQATAQAELGLYPAAEASYRKALELQGDDLEILLSSAHFFIVHRGDTPRLASEGIELCRRARKLARARGRVDILYELTVLEAGGLNRVGQSTGALRCADEALVLFPDSLDASCERAAALFDLCQLVAAKRELISIIQAAPDDGWALYQLGVLEERDGNFEQSEWYFQLARALSPQDFPLPVRMSDKAFHTAVMEAIDRLPEAIKPYLEGVSISVEDQPSLGLLTSTRPPLSPSIVGVFQGQPVNLGRSSRSIPRAPASITLFRRNLERSGRTRREVREQIAITVHHEAGHLLGLSEEELEERGLH
jgi:predicted Zn-dependent protease with MMP-like domain/Flp pilus assembly protein TadD